VAVHRRHVGASAREAKMAGVQPSHSENVVAQGELFCCPACSTCMRHDTYEWSQVGGFVVEWLVIAAVAGIGLLALLDPGSIEVLFTAEL
jgi:hypothetical protein